MKYRKGDNVRIKTIEELDIPITESAYYSGKSFCGKHGGEVCEIRKVYLDGCCLIMGERIDPRCFEINIYNGGEVWEASSLVEDPVDNLAIDRKLAEVKEILPPENEGPLDEILIKSALRFNEGKPKWTLVHFESLIPLVRVLEYGAKKYAPYNWQKPMSRMDILDSMQRHMAKLIDGEENDEESGLPHVGHILANAMFYSFHVTNKK